MKILQKLTIKNLKLNKKRTIGTIIGIILSVALITAVSGMFTSLQKTLIERSIDETGYNHINLENIDNEMLNKIKNHQNIKNIDIMYLLGYAVLPVNIEEHTFINVYSTDLSTFSDLRFQVNEGRFPNSDNELIISKKMLNKAGLKLGDTIELTVGKRVTNEGYDLDDSNPYNDGLEHLEDEVTKSYKIVGIASKPYWNNSYFALTTSSKNENMKLWIALNNPKIYNETARDILNLHNLSNSEKRKITTKYNYNVNNELLRWEIFAFSDSTISMLYAVIGVVIVIIIITSVFCIRNSFAISTMEKSREYGMLASIGATKKQIKRSVIMEGVMQGIIGVPLGILAGILADAILIKVVNLLSNNSLFNTGGGLILDITLAPIIVASILGFIVIYLSSITSARKASKVSPIDNLRNAEHIKLNSKMLKTPKIISKIFKTGGVISYKNLKRSKKKYRTTVISITISIFAFISMNAFINETFKRSRDYYTDYDYNIVINSRDIQNHLSDIKNLKNINNTFVLYEYTGYIRIDDLSHVKKYNDNAEYKNGINLAPLALDDETFKKYAKKIGVDYNKVKDKGILYNMYHYYDESKNIDVEAERYSYKQGDILEGKINDTLEDIKIEIGAVTLTPPYMMEHHYYGGGYIVFNKDYNKTNLPFRIARVGINTNESDKVEEEIKKIDDNLNVTNFDSEYKEDKNMVLIISIFLYGFITVITLIGVTNIFNTITSNMELRSREFAIFKSIGMTKQEFNRMINLETIFYSSKSLLYGNILGIIGAYFIHRAFSENLSYKFILPYKAILISIIFVFIIVNIIMKYSLKKINKQNIIETIRKENI